ncbi:A-kinase anchor protein 12 isoform X2 [Bufo gargarizans]|uniref:A-kinase anchor protein 12 isoform X2 n=1 Tax=Bufo gargarizans TaxID=30331 RepID=UPI001CF1F98E|nr:A-kinase anchor protein 12 isoform X2 [Bufo gargarizans]
MLGTITLTVEQQEPASVTLDKEAAEDMGIVHNDSTAEETAKEDDQVETPEAIDITPEFEEKAESPGQANENQNNEVGFKKVFKFVGFKFTVKKDKTEKSEPVQLLTVKKDEVEVNGTDYQTIEEHINTDNTEVGKTEIQDPNNSEKPSESPDKPALGAESPNETPEENQKKVEESEGEKDQKSPESPTNAVVTETSSPFRRFFTQGWAGLRKKTSFKKSKEEDPQEVEKQIKVEEQEKNDVPKAVEEESTTETQPAENHSVLQELSKSSSEDSKVSAEENIEIIPEDKPKQEEPSLDDEAALKLEGSVKEDEEVAPAAENKEYTPETVTSVPEAIELSKVKAEAETLEDNIETQTTDEIAVEPAAEGINEDLQGTSETGAVDNDQSQLVSSTESGEAITTEAELLSTQEKAKIQGSPLKKLFSSSGLRKLSGKKTKSKKEDEGKIEITAEAISSEFPEAREIDGGDSSPSSPDESADTSPIEKPSDEVQQTTEVEGEGATSDGERRKDGITPWASFKKLVTPKRRPKRPSESDKEDEVEKAKTSTMSSTDSAGTGENQEEPKETNEEQKLEKSTEESKKKVDTSVSWEALICVGSAKKRARKTSDSDSDEGIKSQDEAKKTEEIVPAKETDSDSPITSSQEQQIQESTSPDQTGSPTESDGVSTWQSFKRLVTPRRKSRTRVEDKTDENATAANAEQSTSEGEAGKEETWVSFKKLIPGRKKKKSDGKQEHAPTTEAGQALNESAEDDSDEPAVVPLSEFDAAEQEKLDAQILEEAIPTIGGEQEGYFEKSTEELIHAVTVTVIEGERAITSLEERSPSWISATVSKNIEHAKETEEAIERIKTEVTVEETVVLSTVSQVMTVVPNTLMNEMELTSEALTALEEAIENSCAEETTEMISAVSQLGESVVSTEEATPVPEEDATMKTLEDQKKHTESILHEAAEKAKLTVNTFQLQTSQDVTDVSATMEDKEIVCESAPLCAEEQTLLTPVSLEAHNITSTIVSAEETVEQICITVFQKTKESVTTSETVQNYLNTPVATLDQTVNICISASLSKEEQADESTLLGTDKSDGHLLTSSEDQVVEETPVVTESLVKDSTTDLEVYYAKVDSRSAEDIKKNDDLTSSTDVKESVLALAEIQDEEVSTAVAQVQIADNACTSNELQTKESVFASVEVVPVSREVQPEEVVSVSSEVQHEEVVPVSSEIQTGDVVAGSSEYQPEVVVALAGEVKSEENVTQSSKIHPEEVAPVSSEVQPEDVAPVSSEVQPEDVAPVSSEVQLEEVAHVSSGVQLEQAAPIPSELQPEEVVPVSSKVQPEEIPLSNEAQPEEVVTVSSEVQPEEVAPVSSEVQPEEVAPASSEVQSEEVAPASSEVQPEDVAPVSSKVQPEEVAPVSSEVQSEVAPASSAVQPEDVAPVQPEEVAHVSSEVQPEEVAPASSEVQPEDVAPVSSKVQPEEVGPVLSEVQSEVAPASSAVQPEDFSPVQPEEVAHVSSGVHPEEVAPVSHEVQPEEVAPVSCEVQPEKFVPVTIEVQPEEGLHISSELQSEEVVPISCEVQPEDVEPVLSEVEMVKASEVQLEDSNEVKPEECAAVSVEMESEEGLNVPVENKVEEYFSVSDDAQAEEGITVTAELQTEESVPVLNEAQDEASDSVLSEAKIEESSSVLVDANINKVAPVLANLQVEEQAPELVEMQADESAPISKAAEDNVQVDEGTNLSADAQPGEKPSVLNESQAENTSSVFAEAQDSDQVSSNVQTEEVGHRTSEVQAKEVSPLSDELQAEESSQESVELQTEESVDLTQVYTEKIAPVAVELISDVQSEVCEVQAEEVTESVEIQDDGNASAALIDEHKEHIEEVIPVNKVDTKENVSENDAQESERVLVSIEDSCSDSQIQKVITEGTMAVTDVLLAEPQTSELQSENTCTYSDNTEFKDTPPTTAPEEAKEPEEEGKDKITHSQEEIVEIIKEEEVITSDIPELQSSEAIKASEPVTAAAVEEQVLTENVKNIEIPQDSIEDHDRRSEDIEVLSNGVQVIAESVSQKAAAIVDAAIEAATNCFVVDATLQDKALEETTVSEHVEITEKTNVKTISIESCSTTIVQSIIETAVETIVSNIHINKTVSIQGQNLENEIDSQLQETASVHEPIKSSEQLEESEELMRNTGKEFESAIVAHIQDENEHQTSTQASEVNAQEKAPTVES